MPAYPPLPASDPCHCLETAHDFSLPPCPCGDKGFVPLGLFSFERGGRHDHDHDTKEDYSGRRYVFGPLHPYTLTHISKVNWTHGVRRASRS